jgi:hypothetical protein
MVANGRLLRLNKVFIFVLGTTDCPLLKGLKGLYDELIKVFFKICIGFAAGFELYTVYNIV